MKTKIAKFMGPIWGPPGSCRPQNLLAPWTLLSGNVLVAILDRLQIKCHGRHLILLFHMIVFIQWPQSVDTVYPKKYAHGFCFAVLCCGYTLTDFPISIRLTSLALWQSNDCPSASKATLMNMDKYFMWIRYERLHNHNKAKHNKTVWIFLGIYCNLIFHQIKFQKWMSGVGCVCKWLRSVEFKVRSMESFLHNVKHLK